MVRTNGKFPTDNINNCLKNAIKGWDNKLTLTSGERRKHFIWKGKRPLRSETYPACRDRHVHSYFFLVNLLKTEYCPRHFTWRLHSRAVILARLILSKACAKQVIVISLPPTPYDVASATAKISKIWGQDIHHQTLPLDIMVSRQTGADIRMYIYFKVIILLCVLILVSIPSIDCCLDFVHRPVFYKYRSTARQERRPVACRYRPDSVQQAT